MVPAVARCQQRLNSGMGGGGDLKPSSFEQQFANYTLRNYFMETMLYYSLYHEEYPLFLSGTRAYSHSTLPPPPPPTFCRT